ncbi:type VI secretion system Vgr family protein [Aestuariispira ectoiniformans]|uniref:type VI secretion system Vgr family protein n=1 Tax=Aestuariispira ectoiniformans TaxID=2775080 RepID=UPI0021F8519E|nr:type VI secretion system tip protein TssI/VgrG [Aestuariispira ectoiniformans]
MKDVETDEMFSGQAQRVLGQDQDLAFAFSGAVGDLRVVGFTASESINEPFEVQVDLASDDADIELQGLMDEPACVGIYNKYDEPRFLHGIVTEAERGDSGTRRTFYKVTLRPTLSRLDHGSDSRIWQAKTVPEIVAEVFDQYTITNVEWRLEEDHGVREYCTQYRETHRAFVERLLAEEGIFYFFEHSRSGHKMILTDTPLTTPVLQHAAEIQYNSRSGGQSRSSWVSAFSQRERLRSTAYELNDYTFKNPPANQRRNHVGQEKGGQDGNYALYDYPGRYKDPSVGDPFTKFRIESVRADATTGQGVTNNIHLSPGYHFELKGHDVERVNGRHRVLSVSHSGAQSAALEEDSGGGETRYSASFTTMPGHLPYRPPLARKPLVDGPQIAIVTGPASEEIYCDEYGRVKVWFPWDRYGQKNELSSCWIRVSQNWAGGTWGHMAVPRIGHEVIVDYLEGDPDQPIVTGRTYNAVNRPPMSLPEHKTRTTIKSQTHKGEGFNELTFEDEADQEFIYMHAQKNMELHVVNSRKKRVDYDDTATIGNNSYLAVAKDRVEKIDNNMDLTVTKNLTEKVDGERGLTVGGAYMTKSGGDLTFKSDGEIVLDASKITLVSGGTAVVVSGGSVDVAPVLNVGAASPGAAAVPAIPAVLEAAAGSGSPFVSHCPKDVQAK